MSDFGQIFEAQRAWIEEIVKWFLRYRVQMVSEFLYLSKLANIGKYFLYLYGKCYWAHTCEIDLNSCERSWIFYLFSICVRARVKNVTWAWNLVILHSTLRVFERQTSFYMYWWSQMKIWMIISHRSYVQCIVHGTMMELRPNEIHSCVLRNSSCQMTSSWWRISCKKNQIKRMLELKMTWMESWGRDLKFWVMH